MNIHARVGDQIVVDSDQLGHPPRTGEVLEVLGEVETRHYRVRWDDGHESIFFPGSSSHVVHPGARHRS